MADVSITSSDLPSLYKMADRVSLAAQREFIRMTFTYMVALVNGAAETYVSNFPGSSPVLLIAAALLFMTAALISLWLFFQKPDSDWYYARSVAESVKTMAWRWMMRATPYDEDINAAVSRNILIRDLREVLQQNRDLANRIGEESLGGDAIPQAMEKVRHLPLAERVTVYKRDRIDDQLGWYGQKAQYNRARGKQWLGVCIALNLLAISLLLYKVQTPNVSLPVEVVAVLASSSLTWMQVKKFRELAASYGLAAHEITLIQGEAQQVDDEGELSRFVSNAENAFSREHTQWSARKD